jgi:hypothetical protein
MDVSNFNKENIIHYDENIFSSMLNDGVIDRMAWIEVYSKKINKFENLYLVFRYRRIELDIHHLNKHI